MPIRGSRSALGLKSVYWGTKNEVYQVSMENLWHSAGRRSACMLPAPSVGGDSVTRLRGALCLQQALHLRQGLADCGPQRAVILQAALHQALRPGWGGRAEGVQG
jgi:hypothetical protein